MSLKHRIVVGSLRWDDKTRLTDTGLKIMYTNFVGTVFGNDFHYQSDDLDATLMIEGEPKPEMRKIGTLNIGTTSILALQSSITHMQEHPKEAKRVPGKLSISLGIGSSLFGIASMTFWAMMLPDELGETALSIIEEFDTFEDGELAWLDSANPGGRYRGNMHELNEQLMRRIQSG